MKKEIIEIKNISLEYRIKRELPLKSYLKKVTSTKKKIENKNFLALKNISFSVDKGDVVGIIGGNGAGKSTLLRVIAGILATDGGEVKVHSNSISLLALGIGFQNDLTGKDNIYMNGLLLGMSIEKISLIFDKIVEFSELGEFIHAPLRTYSSGMRSKLAFSIVSHIEPEILLIDEVFSVGDQKFKKKSSERIKELIQDKRTVIMVSHSIGTIKELCNKVLWLEKGEKIMFGEKEKVVAEYEKTYS